MAQTLWQPPPLLLFRAAVNGARVRRHPRSRTTGWHDHQLPVQNETLRLKRLFRALGYRHIGDRRGPAVTREFPPGGRLRDAHESGYALDVEARGRVGDRVANIALALVGPFPIYVVIWNFTIWYADKGLREYTGPNPHIDHVHVELGVFQR